MKHMCQSPKHAAPLDALVVSRLEAILNSEKQLQQRYTTLTQSGRSDDSAGCVAAVWKLRLQADRLARMLDALDGEYVADPPEKNTLAAA